MSEPKIYFIDQSYDNHPGVSEAEASELEKSQIESEFNIRVEPANIGAGADLPAFMVTLGNYAPIAIPVLIFFQGKAIKENLDAWIELGKALVKFLDKPLHMNREAAALAALHVYAENNDTTPTKIQLLGYRKIDRRFIDTILIENIEINGYDTAPKEIDLGDTIHILKMNIDDSLYRFIIRGRSVKMELLEEMK